jgi:putative ABC transport system permease protein
MIAVLLADLKTAWRALRAAPATSLAAVLTLALGTGATVAVLSAAYGALARPLPFADADRLVVISPTFQTSGPGRGTVRLTELEDWRRSLRVFDGLAGWSRGEFTVRGLAVPESLQAAVVTDDFFDVVGARPLAGTLESGTPGTVVVADRLARRIGAAGGVWSRTLTVGGRALQPRAILPPGFPLPDDVDLWVSAEDVDVVRLGTSDFRSYGMIGRLASGVTLAQAREDAARVAAAIDGEAHRAEPRRVDVLPIREALVGDVRPLLVAFSAAASLLLLAACANVATLLVSRSMRRAREFAVRLALGASPARLVRTTFAESLLLGAAGAMTGVVLAVLSVRLLRPLAADVLPDLAFVSVVWPAVVAGAVSALAVAILCGLAPAMAASRASFGAALKTASAAGTRAGRRTRNGLVVLQMAAAIVLLVGASLLGRTVYGLLHTDLGVDSEDTLTLRLPLTETARFDAASRNPFVNDLVARVRALPGVEAAGVGSSLPPRASQLVMTISVVTDTSRDTQPFDLTSVTPGYLEALGAHLLRGRLFEPDDMTRDEPVAILSESAAAQIGTLGDPLDRPLRYQLPSSAGPRVRPRVVGVVSDIRFSGLESSPRGNIYVTRAQLAPGTAYLVVRARGSAEAIAPAVVRAVRELDPTLPVGTPRTLVEEVAQAVIGRRLRLVLVGAFAGIAVLLAVTGLVGALIRAVAERRRELAIRAALGASPRRAAGLVLREAFGLAAGGIAIGVGGALAAGRWVGSFLYGVSPFDAPTIALVAAGVLVVALTAGYLPARRAARVEPLDLMRSE